MAISFFCSNAESILKRIVFFDFIKDVEIHIVNNFFNRVFGHEGDAADDIIYINWLNMVRAGLLGLEFYTPENKKWRQVSLTLKSGTSTHIYGGVLWEGSLNPT